MPYLYITTYPSFCQYVFDFFPLFSSIFFEEGKLKKKRIWEKQTSSHRLQCEDVCE